MLVYYERHTEISVAIKREKQIKRWLRKWKLELIEKKNPNWNDLFYELYPEYVPYREELEASLENEQPHSVIPAEQRESRDPGSG